MLACWWSEPNKSQELQSYRYKSRVTSEVVGGIIRRKMQIGLKLNEEEPAASRLMLAGERILPPHNLLLNLELLQVTRDPATQFEGEKKKRRKKQQLEQAYFM